MNDKKIKLKETKFKCKKCNIEVVHYHDTIIKKSNLCHKCETEKFTGEKK